MGSQPKTERKVPIRRVATAMLAVAVMIGGIGVTESAALWRRLGSENLSLALNDVQVCRDGVVTDVLVTVNDEMDAYTIGGPRYAITILDSQSETGEVDPASVVVDRVLDGSDPEFRYLTDAGLPEETKAALDITGNDNSVVRHYFGRFVVPFPELQDVDAQLYIDSFLGSDQFPAPHEALAEVSDCRIWPAAFGSFVAQLFNRLFRAFGWGNQGITSIPTLAG